MAPVTYDFGDFLDMIGRSVQPEVQLGDALQVQVLAEATPEVSLGTVQSFDGILLFLITAHNADIHPGILEVVAQLDPGNRDESDTRILQTMLNQLGDFRVDQFLYPL